jgi:hypothetical protein
VSDDVHSTILGVLGHARLIYQSAKEGGREFLEILMTQPLMQGFQHEVTSVTLDTRRPGLVDFVFTCGSVCYEVDRLSERVERLISASECGQELLSMSTDSKHREN